MCLRASVRLCVSVCVARGLLLFFLARSFFLSLSLSPSVRLLGFKHCIPVRARARTRDDDDQGTRSCENYKKLWLLWLLLLLLRVPTLFLCSHRRRIHRRPNAKKSETLGDIHINALTHDTAEGTSHTKLKTKRHAPHRHVQHSHTLTTTHTQHNTTQHTKHKRTGCERFCVERTWSTLHSAKSVPTSDSSPGCQSSCA